MWENNQNLTTQNKWIAIPQYKNVLKGIAENRVRVKQEAENESLNHLSSGAMELDNNAYASNDEELNKEYKKNSQLAAVSYMVKYAAKQNGADWSNYRNVSEVMSAYFDRFPENAGKIKEFINSDRDPIDFWIEMWWVETDKEEETLNWLERVWEWLKMPTNMIWQWAVDLAWRWLRKTWESWMADALSIDDYAFRKYWKYIADMTEDEIARLQLDLDIDAAKNWNYIMSDWNASWQRYVPDEDRQRLDVAATEIWMWVPLQVLEFWYLPAYAWFTAWGETPYVNLPIQLLWMWGRWIWELISMIPWVDWWVSSLPEDVQENVKTIWGLLVLGKMAQKGTTYKWWELRPWVKKTLNGISSNEIIWGIMDYVSKYGDNIKNSDLYKKLDNINNNPKEALTELWNDTSDVLKNGWGWTKQAASDLWKSVKDFAKSSDYKKLEKEWARDDAKMDAAWRMSWASWKESVQQTQIYKNELERLWNDVLWELTKKKTVTQWDLLDVMDEHSNWYEAWEDWIYSRNTARFKPWQSKWMQEMVDKDTWISARPREVDPIWEWIKALQRIYKNDRNMLQQLDIVKRKWMEKWLTRAEANQLARQIAEWAKIYKEWMRDMYTAEYMQEIEQVRRDLKAWAREPFKESVPWVYKVLEYLDNAWSDNLNTKAMVKNNINELRTYRNDFPRQEDWQKKWWFISRTIDSKWKNIADSIFQSRRYNPVTRDAWLRDNIKDFIKNNKEPSNQYEKIIRDWYDATFRDVVNPDGTYYNVWEWEVMYPRRNSYIDNRNYLEDIVQIVEDTAAEWTTPKNLINKYWNLDNQLKALWLSDAEIAEANNVIYQWWLFWWEPVEVANVEWGVMTKVPKDKPDIKKWKKTSSNPK